VGTSPTRRAQAQAQIRASKYFSRILLGVFVLTVACLVGLILMTVFIPDPTPSQAKTLDTLRQGFLSGLAGLIGLLTGKLT
jgi:hypothetical protein